jgi:hypothetical protein
VVGPTPNSEHSGASFQPGGYAVARGFVSPETVALATRYARLAAELSPRRGDSQVVQSHARYGDPLMECLLEQLWPGIEQLAGVELWPTYAYHRVYYPGAELTLHRDRPSCEISASLCLGFEYQGVAPAYRWPLQMVHDGQTRDLALEPGDLVLYEGCQLPHARPRFDAGEGSFHAQVFLHFVRRAGRFAICKFDGRPRLGLPADTADPTLEQRILELEREVLGDVSAQRGSAGA